MPRLRHIQSSEEKWVSGQLDDSHRPLFVHTADLETVGFNQCSVVRVESIVAIERLEHLVGTVADQRA